MPQQQRAEAEAELVETARRVLPGGGFGNVSHEVIIAHHNRLLSRGFVELLDAEQVRF